MNNIETSYLEQDINFPKIIEKFQAENLVILFRRIPKDLVVSHQNAWWTPNGIIALNYGGKDGQLWVTAIPLSVLQILIQTQLVETILPEDEDDDHYFPQYKLQKPIRSYKQMPTELINKMFDEYKGRASEIIHPYQAMNLAISISKQIGLQLLGK